MCTATWFFEPEGFHLFFNRDERHSRASGRPPEASESGCVRFVAPRDGDFGGSWIAVNEYGVALALLNGYRSADETAIENMRSRGLLLTDLANASSLEELEERVSSMSLDRYRSFRLLGIESGGSVRVAEWTRDALEIDRDGESRRPLVSSSFEETEVGTTRRATFEDEVRHREPSEDVFVAYHRSHTQGPSAYSVCMHREDARSQSFTHVWVTKEAARLTYHAGPPCEAAEDFAISLPIKDMPGFP